MQLFWANGPMFIREALEKIPEPRPHFNTVSTFVHLLEDKGFLAHESIGRNYRYYPIISEDDYSRSTLKGVISRYFNNSLHNAICALVAEEKLSDAEIQDLINLVKSKK